MKVREIAQGIRRNPHRGEAGTHTPDPGLALLCMPVDVSVEPEERLPEPVEVAAYYVAAEALTNAAETRRTLHVPR